MPGNLGEGCHTRRVTATWLTDHRTTDVGLTFTKPPIVGRVNGAIGSFMVNSPT